MSDTFRGVANQPWSPRTHRRGTIILTCVFTALLSLPKLGFHDNDKTEVFKSRKLLEVEFTKWVRMTQKIQLENYLNDVIGSTADRWLRHRLSFCYSLSVVKNSSNRQKRELMIISRFQNTGKKWWRHQIYLPSVSAQENWWCLLFIVPSRSFRKFALWRFSNDVINGVTIF